MARFALIAGACAVLAASGCRSPYIQATVHNGSGGTVRLLEVDYPSASFGKESLAPGADFQYRFKILGSGATKVTWTDSRRHEHTVPGPELREGQEGRLVILLTPEGAEWKSEFQVRR